MWKKLIALTVALIISTSFTMTAFAGNTEGVSDAAAPAAVTAAKNSTLVKDAVQNDEISPSKQEQGNSVVDDDKKSTYDDEEMRSPDAKFYTAIKKVLDEGEAVNNDQSILLITKPEDAGNMISVFNKDFNISVTTGFDDVVYSIARYNNETEKYEIIDFDGEKWIILATKADSKEIKLEYGINSLMLVSYRNAEKLVSKVQYNTIVVTKSNKAARDKAVSPEKTYNKPSSDPITKVEQNIQTLIGNFDGLRK